MIGHEKLIQPAAPKECVTLADVMNSFTESAHRELIDDAYFTAALAHKGQVRLSRDPSVTGDPQIKHVERVSVALANSTKELSDDERAEAIAAALLHDVVEDSDVSAEEIAEKFGDNVVQLVQALSHEELPDGGVDEDESAEVHLGRIAALPENLRKTGFLIRRCDRLDNLRTLLEAPDEFRRNEIQKTKDALGIWQQYDPEGVKMIREAVVRAEAPDHITGKEGLSAINEKLVAAEGSTMSEFWRSQKGAEFLHTPKIIVAGAPQSGKSVFRELIKGAVRAIPGSPYPYFLTGAPDGEWAGFQESVGKDPELARKMKDDYKQAIKDGGSMFTPEYVQRISKSLENLSAPDTPLNFVDIGGKRSVENLGICAPGNAAIVLCGEKYAGTNEVGEWKEFFAELGIPVIALMYSDYFGSEDVVEGVGEDGLYRGSVHYLERGELDHKSRPAVGGLAEYILSLQKEGYVALALDNLARTSRTAAGVVDTSASDTKADSMNNITSEEAVERTTENFKGVIESLYNERNRQFENPTEVRSFVERIAQNINAGITKEEVLVRTHDSEKYPYTKSEDLEIAMSEFYQQLFSRLQGNEDPRELAAWVEYRIDLSDHFFADGCGKTAKALSSWVLMRAGDTLPQYTNRTELYANAPTKVRGEDAAEDARALEAWTTYYKGLFIR